MSFRGDLLNVLRAEARDADLKLYLKPKALTLLSFANVNNTCKSTRLCLQLVFMRCRSGFSFQATSGSFEFWCVAVRTCDTDAAWELLAGFISSSYHSRKKAG